MVWYITSELHFKLMGGIGHTFITCLYPSYIISRIYNMQHVYTQFPELNKSSLKSRYYQLGKGKPDAKVGIHMVVADKIWDDFFNFKKGSLSINNVKCKKIHISLVRPFNFVSLEILTNFFKKFNKNEDILFVWTNNNLLDCDEIYNKYPNIYNSLRMEFKNKCLYKPIVREKESKLLNIVLHIRKGDVPMGTNDFYKKMFDTFITELNKYYSKPKLNITIVSYGTEAEMTEIRDIYKSTPGLSYKLNIDRVETFKVLMNADIMLFGPSTYPLMAGYYSNAKILIGCSRKPFLMPAVIEDTYDFTRGYIRADDKGNFNLDLLRSALLKM